MSDCTRLIIVNSPNNPTGGVETADSIKALARIVRDGSAWVLSDEIYGYFIFEGTHHSIASADEMAERTIILDGFSKAARVASPSGGIAAAFPMYGRLWSKLQ